MASLRQNAPFFTPDDIVASPTYLPDLTHACLDLLIDGEQGIWHVVNRGAPNLADFVRQAARHAGLDAALVAGVPAAVRDFDARGARFTALANERGQLLADLDDALVRFTPRLAACDAVISREYTQQGT